MKKNNCAIIIVNWNGLRHLKKCFKAINGQNYKYFKVYFIDNGSVDNSVNFVKNEFPNTKILKLKKNYGFTGGNNHGIKYILKNMNIKYLVFLNNDTIVDKYWLKEMITTAEESSDVGMVSSKTLFPNGKINTIGLSLEKCQTSNFEGGASIGYNTDKSNFNKKIEVFAPSGVSALYKREVIENVGMFDDDFFCYGEDLDLGYRARLAGWRCVYNPNSKLIHLNSQSLGNASSLKAFYIKRNSYFYRIKNYPLLKLISYPYKDFYWLLKNLLVKTKLNSVSSLKLDIGNFGIFKILLRVYFEVIKYTPKLLKKRLHIQNNKSMGNKEINSWFHKFCRSNFKQQ